MVVWYHWVFVLLLACINFMNLSTARSEKRAKEVGIRKAIGSMRQQLIKQFFSESLLVAFIGIFYCHCIGAINACHFLMMWLIRKCLFLGNPLFWLLGISFTLLQD